MNGLIKAGFDCIDLNLDVFLKNSELYQGEMNRFFEQSIEELRQYFTSYQEGARRFGLSRSQMHAPYPVWVLGREEQNRIMVETVIPKCLAIAGFLGIPMWSSIPSKMQYRTDLSGREKAEHGVFKNLIKPAREHNNVTICLENL
ncbi:MAG: hypothetical protein ACLTBV_31630 [Enterocloster bolteae]